MMPECEVGCCPIMSGTPEGRPLWIPPQDIRRKYKPHDYQKYAVRYIIEHPITALFLDCGLGKTSVTLTAILQANVPEKYSLSPRACQGILRRALIRGKELPEVLRIALEKQANSV